MTRRSTDQDRVVVTGAAGALAADLVPHLQSTFDVVGYDLAPRPPEWTCGWVQGSVLDRSALRSALEGAVAVVHLAGIPLEAPWEDVRSANVDGSQSVLESAVDAGVPRVVLASSIHAVGYTPVPAPGELVPDGISPRPDTLYGVTKAAMEALGSYYHDRFGLDVVCLRIASRARHPFNERSLSTWLSPADTVRLVMAALAVPDPGFRLVWGVSENRRRNLSPLGGVSIGFRPLDDAEESVGPGTEELTADPARAASRWDRTYLGGDFCSPDPPTMERRGLYATCDES